MSATYGELAEVCLPTLRHDITIAVRHMWEQPRKQAGDLALCIYEPSPPVIPLKDLSTALRTAQIFDDSVIEVPGSVVVMPLGAQILKNYRALVRECFGSVGLDEVEYPFILPFANLALGESIFSLKDLLLHVGDDSSWDNGVKRLSLCPTGEALFYTHWKKRVRSHKDLPIKNFQQGRYFRPLSSSRHSGGSVFKCLESCDVFEAHACFPERADAIRFLADLRRAIQALIERLSVPTIWGVRPSEFNRSEVSDLSIAGDSLLLSGGTVQTACLYDQGQIFSQAFGISFSRDGAKHYPFQATAAVTRRLLYVLLQLGMRKDKTLFVHPAVAPSTVFLVFKSDSDFLISPEEIAVWKCAFEAVNRRPCCVMKWGQGVSYGQILRAALRSGCSLLAVLRLPDRRLTLVRLDTFEEWNGGVLEPELAAGAAKTAVMDIEDTFASATRKLARQRLVHVNTLKEVVEHTRRREVTLCSVSLDRESLKHLASLHCGEVLCLGSQLRSGETIEGSCVVTGKRVQTVAVVSTRI